MKECIIKTTSARDYYTVGALDFYWESLIKHLGSTIELVASESKGKRLKRLVYTVEVKNISRFEKLIKKSTFDNWSFTRNYSVKQLNKEENKRKAEAKIERLRKELKEAEENYKLF